MKEYTDEIKLRYKNMKKTRKICLKNVFEDLENEIIKNKKKLSTKFNLNPQLMQKWTDTRLRIKIFVLFYNEIRCLNFYGTEFIDCKNKNMTRKKSLNDKKDTRFVEKKYVNILEQLFNILTIFISVLQLVYMPFFISYVIISLDLAIIDIIVSIYFCALLIIDIKKNYYKQNLLYNLLSIAINLPFSFYVYIQQQYYCQNNDLDCLQEMIFIQLQWIKLWYGLIYLYTNTQFSYSIEFITKFLKIKYISFKAIFQTLNIALLVHFLNCYWIFLGLLLINRKLTWMSELDTQDPQQLYLSSFYLTLQTITCVGYGDLTPKNDEEYMYSIFNLILGLSLNSLIFGFLMNSLQNSDSKQSILIGQKVFMEIFCESASVNKKLRQKIFKSLDQNAKIDHMVVQNKKEFLNRLPFYHKAKLTQNLIIELKNQILFKDKHELFIIESIILMQQMKVQRGQTIYTEGRYPNNIYLIQQGRIVFTTKKGLTFTNFVQDSYFGDIELIKNIKLKYNQQYQLTQFNTKAAVNSNLFIIQETDFRQLMEQFPDYFVEFQNIAMKREIILNKKFQKIQKLEKINSNFEFWKKTKFDDKDIKNYVIQTFENDNIQVNQCQVNQNLQCNAQLLKLSQQNYHNKIIIKIHYLFCLFFQKSFQFVLQFFNYNQLFLQYQIQLSQYFKIEINDQEIIDREIQEIVSYIQEAYVFYRTNKLNFQQQKFKQFKSSDENLDKFYSDQNQAIQNIAINKKLIKLFEFQQNNNLLKEEIENLVFQILDNTSLDHNINLKL